MTDSPSSAPAAQALNDPLLGSPASMQYTAFRDLHKPKIRPKGTLSRLWRAYEIDVHFLESFQILRPYMRRFGEEAAERIATHVVRSKLVAPFSEHDAALFVSLYKKHAAALFRGRFDAAYLDTLEDVALFMIQHDVKTVWLSGAHIRILEDLIDHVFENTPKHRLKRMQTLIKLAAKSISIELNQIQRVFTVYANSALLEAAQTDAVGARLDRAPRALSMEEVSSIREGMSVITPHLPVFAERLFSRMSELDAGLQAGPVDAAATTAVIAVFEAAGDALQAAGAQNRVVTFADLAAADPEVAARLKATIAALETSQLEIIGDAVSSSLAASLGRKWTPSVAEAWSEAYVALVQALSRA